MAMLLVLAVTVAISTVCAQPQCTSHSQRLPYPVESQVIGYSSVSRSVYLVGGDDSSNAKRDIVWRWDTVSATEDWFVTDSTPAPTVMDSKGTQLSVTIGEVMYVCSPRTDSSGPYTAGSAIHPFNTTSEAWLPPIPFTTPSGEWLVRPCATHNETHIFLIDGYMSSAYRDNTPLYIFIFEISSEEWTTQTLDAPFGNGRVRRGWYATACAYANSALYIFGGKYYPGLGDSGSSEILDTIFRYDIDDEQFTLLDATLPAPRAYGPAVFDGEKFVFLPGGKDDNGVLWDTISIFDIETEQLLPESIAAVFPFEDATATILGEELWVFGGNPGPSDVVQRCDISSFYPTQEPTQDPTASPTVSPTTAPPTTPAPTTASPTTAVPTTASPTSFEIEYSYDPTPAPTLNPTQLPTVDPSQSPTSNPSDAPTDFPSVSPTDFPTALPSRAPTLDPTASPTLDPTAAPTLDPTASPTLDPTTSPTLDPTASPTLDPTASPTFDPTATPTVQNSEGTATTETLVAHQSTSSTSTSTSAVWRLSSTKTTAASDENSASMNSSDGKITPRTKIVFGVCAFVALGCICLVWVVYFYARGKAESVAPRRRPVPMAKQGRQQANLRVVSDIEEKQQQHVHPLSAVPNIHAIDSQSDIEEKRDAYGIQVQPDAGGPDLASAYQSSMSNRAEGLRASVHSVVAASTARQTQGLEEDEFEVVDDDYDEYVTLK